MTDAILATEFTTRKELKKEKAGKESLTTGAIVVTSLEIMNSPIPQQLELDKILHELSLRTATHHGTLQTRSLSPSRDMEVVQNCLRDTTQAREMIEQCGRPPFGGISDVHHLIRKATRGATLDGQELVQVGETARGLRCLREFIDRTEPGRYPRMQSLAMHIPILREAEREIVRCLRETGKVKDEASDSLRTIRVEIQQLTGTIQSRVYSIARDPRFQTMLQESLVTLRNDRYCVPLKVEFKGEFDGIIHDRSGSGATLFVEPIEIVNLNNRMRELHLDESEEVERILKRLSQLVALHAEEMETGLTTAYNLDLMIAKGQLSLDWDCSAPTLNREGRFDFRQARHPLLHQKAVPIDLHVGKDYLTLLITGPNTGGKTVALKTIGLLSLMTWCGLHVPAAPKSDVAVGGAIFCDIGDEQSIEHNLSTFSAHLAQVVSIIVYATAADLVLLDEVGTGTDPEEGAALAKSVLVELTTRGARTIATTHHGELKSFVYQQEGMENAAVEFDEESLNPTYRLHLGTPGSSHALTIARRLGMPQKLVERAQGYLSPERRAMDHLLNDLEKQRAILERETANLQCETAKAERLQRSLEAEQEAIQQERIREQERVHAEGKFVIGDARKEVQEILRSLRNARQESAETEAQRERLRVLEQKVEALAPPVPEPSLSWDTSLQPGDMVRVRQANRTGVLLSLPDPENQVWVRMGNVRVEVSASQIEKTTLTSPAASSPGVARLRLERALNVNDEIDLHGWRVEQALEELDGYLDDVLLAELDSVRIVHGIGTGALRNAIRAYLTNHPSVAEFSYADPNGGGAGVTVVRLRS